MGDRGAAPSGLEAVAEAVADIVGAPVVSSEVVWDRPHVVRVRLEDGRSLVTKRPRVDDAGEVTELSRTSFERELAVLSFLTSLDEASAPRLLGHRDELLVMEDLPPGPSLAELLLVGDERAARLGLVAYAEGLGRFHAATAFDGAESRFDAVRDAHEPSQPWGASMTDDAVDAFVSAAERFGPVPDRGALASEVRAIADALGAPGWWRTMVHGDPCPDNTRFESGTGRFRLFDFERSSFGSCLLDASYVVAPFPTCWCFGEVPGELSAEAVAAYRTAFGVARPEVLDDRRWDEALAMALGSWIVARGHLVATHLDGEDRTWGTTTVRVRLRRWLDAFVEASERSDAFPALRAAGAVMADGLAVAWPDAQVGAYPALASGAAAPSVVDTPDWWHPGL